MRVSRLRLSMSSLLAALAVASSTLAGETLYNGIILPDAWPPKIDALTREPMPVPYLEHRPEVVPIDVGRQLFVDDFLIEESTLKRTYHTATFHPACPVLRPDKPWESISKNEAPPKPVAMVFSDGVMYDPAAKLFKMWYMAGPCSSTCYAISKDGIHWEKPPLDVVPGTNIVMDRPRDSATVWVDPNERDPARRYKMLAFLAPKGRPDFKTNPWRSELYYSADGVHWSESVATRKEECDRTTFFYNPFRNVWVFSLRAYISSPIYRCRYYAESKTLDESYPRALDGSVRWASSDRLDPHHPDPELKDVLPQLYNLDAVAYESLMLGLFSIWQGQHDKSKGLNGRREVLVGFSRDGFHWHRPDRQRFAGVNETDGAWNWGNVQSAGGCCLVVGDQLYFYVSGRGKKGASDPCSTGMAVLRRDGFASLDADDKAGTITTRPLTFKGRHLFVNADAACGELRVEVLDRSGKVLPGFGAGECVPVSNDATIQPVQWKRGGDLAAVASQPVRFRFHLKRGKLYSFWVSPEKSGASLGYVAGGGPGYTGPSDTVGMAALAAARAAVLPADCKTPSAAECPAWAKETVPVWVQPYLGQYGLPAPYPQRHNALGECTDGIDKWQVNHLVGYRAETARYLYEAYTPLAVPYRKGTLPAYEKLVTECTAGLKTDREKALALLQGILRNIGHPRTPPYSPMCPPDRSAGDEELLRSAMGWCNEQARVFVRACQVAGIPARLVFLFYSEHAGHVISEFYAEGGWCMADSSWGCVFAGADGKLMSAAQCHADAASRRKVQESYTARARELASWTDEALVGRKHASIIDQTERARKIAEEGRLVRDRLQRGREGGVGTLGLDLWAFGVLNYPLPN